MSMIRNLFHFFNFSIPATFDPRYLIEIAILSVAIYHLLKWFKSSRAWTLLGGIGFVIVFAILAYAFKLTTITWLISKTAGFLVIILVVIFQQELRRVLEQLGRKNTIFTLISSLSGGQTMTIQQIQNYHRSWDEIVEAVFAMSKVKTGALIVVENKVMLDEHIRTGLDVDAVITSQLIINIFEKNTPLHDGAVFIRNNRIHAATVYLPMSENMSLSKELGTRHRAGIGISEVSDCLAIIVSEETGSVSLAQDGRLIRHIKPDILKKKLYALTPVTEQRRFKRRGMISNGEEEQGQ